jgi:hypothetical protein
MRHSSVAVALAAGLLIAAAGPAAAGTASAVRAGPGEVDTGALVPELFPGYDWDCKLVAGAPLCRGKMHHDPSPGVVDDFCQSPVVWTVEGVRTSTRHYGEDYVLQWRTGRVREVERQSRPDGSAYVDYRVNTHYTTTYDVPGDFSTGTQVTKGSLWDFRTNDGRIIYRTVGTLTEPHDGEATFTGSVNREGTITRVVDAPLSEVIDEEWLFGKLCAVTDG